MGTYVLDGEELVEEFVKFLGEQEGDVCAEAIAEAWNIIAKKERWHDRLIPIHRRDYRKLIKEKPELKEGIIWD